MTTDLDLTTRRQPGGTRLSERGCGTRMAALDELTQHLDANILGLSLQSLARGENPRIPDGMAQSLAYAVLAWAAEQGLTFEG